VPEERGKLKVESRHCFSVVLTEAVMADFAPHTPGNADGCEMKGVAGKAVCKDMKTKDEKKTVGTSERLKGRVRAQKGYHPRCDEKSAEAIENGRDTGGPLRKRARNRLKLRGLQGCK
jgi:hypothetical protein